MLFTAFIVEKKRKTTGDGSSLVAASSSKSAPARPMNNTARSVPKPIGLARSTVVERLASISHPAAKLTETQAIRDYGHKRDERLVLVENLTPGPYQHKNIPDDPNFDKFEPHSSIRLSYVPPKPHVIACTLISGGATFIDRGTFRMTSLSTFCEGGTTFPLRSFTPQSAYCRTNKDTMFQ